MSTIISKNTCRTNKEHWDIVTDKGVKEEALLCRVHGLDNDFANLKQDNL